MPQIKLTNNKTIYCWKITETISELRGLVRLSEEELRIFHSFRKDKRKLEILASRALLQSIIPESHIKYVNKNPTLEGSDEEISISHSGEKVLIQLKEKDELVGVDIQMISEQTIRIKHKFLHESEQILIEKHKKDNLLLTNLFWSAKESVFKAFASISTSEEVIEFKTQIIFEAINFRTKKITGSFIESDNTVNFEIGLYVEDEFVVTWFDKVS